MLANLSKSWVTLFYISCRDIRSRRKIRAADESRREVCVNLLTELLVPGDLVRRGRCFVAKRTRVTRAFRDAC